MSVSRSVPNAVNIKGRNHILTSYSFLLDMMYSSDPAYGEGGLVISYVFSGLTRMILSGHS